MKMYKLSYYVPESHLEVTKQALFDAGAGCYPEYDQVCWQVSGTGQFRPLSGSDAFIGEKHKLASVSEYRVELLCKEAVITDAIRALLSAHPYEAPAYDAIKLDYYPETQ